MGARFKTFDATGIAPGGRVFAGDLNSIQDMKADSSDFAATIDLATLRIGDSSIQLIKYGTAEARISAALRTDGLLRGLGGIIAGSFTTTARDAIALSVGLAPYGTVIINTTTNRYEWNAGTDASRTWMPVGVDGSGQLTISASAPVVNFVTAGDNVVLSGRQSGDSVTRFSVREDGQMEWGPGGAGAHDINLQRLGNVLLLNTGMYFNSYVIAGGGLGGGNTSFQAWQSGDTQARWRARNDGVLEWGAGGAAAIDTNLYRVAANQLKSDDNIQAVDGFATKVKAGTPTDADFATTPPVGTLVVDTTASKIWVRTAAATWKSVVVT